MEDEPAIRLAMKRGLKRAGYEVEVASNLCDARDLAKEFQPDVLLSDLKLPDGSGLEIAEELAIPFMLMSGYAVFDDAVAAIRLGCVDFFTKPVAIEDIVERLNTLAATPMHYRPGCIDLHDGVKMILPSSDGFEIQDLQTQDLSWENQAQAQQVFDASETTGRVERQLLSELMQSSDAGRIVVNVSPGRWSAWLDQSINWDERKDRLQCLQQLADICICRDNGVFVEYFDAS